MLRPWRGTLKRLNIFSEQKGLDDEIENVANALNAPSHRIEVQLLRNIAHRRIVVHRIVEGEVTDLVLDTKRANDVKDLSCDVIAGLRSTSSRMPRTSFRRWLSSSLKTAVTPYNA
ncbi:hypothetical protein CRV24_007545 [Beauveria bassiana]|nr:hypothetical protein CRV24_007545 [Beauveria bassiana]